VTVVAAATPSVAAAATATVGAIARLPPKPLCWCKLLVLLRSAGRVRVCLRWTFWPALRAQGYARTGTEGMLAELVNGGGALDNYNYGAWWPNPTIQQLTAHKSLHFADDSQGTNYGAVNQIHPTSTLQRPPPRQCSVVPQPCRCCWRAPRRSSSREAACRRASPFRRGSPPRRRRSGSMMASRCR
jgi:hypothetical protein